MLGTILWNTGALGDVAAWNNITWSPTLGSLASSLVAGSPAVDGEAHTPEILTGNYLGAFGDDFYHRFHITTLLLDLGNLVSDQTTQVTVWNAYRRAWILNSLDIDNGEGVSVTGQPDPPLQFNPLQERTYTIGILADGPSTIDATVTWNFSNGEDVVLSITGSRVVPWTWAPNWQMGMIERLDWYTDVLPAARGEEQRRSLRIDPRQFLEFTPLVSGSDRRFMESALWGWGSRTWAVPLWFDGLELASTLSAGATVVPLNPAQRGFEAGGLLMFITDAKTYEVMEIASLSTTITLERPTQKTWGPGTRVYPARAAVIENEATVTRFTAKDGELRLQWRAVDPMPWAASATPTYRSFPVLEQRPNWIEDPSLVFTRVVSVLDAGVDLTVIEDHTEMPLTSQRMRYTLTSHAEIDTWKQRLWALRGKQGPIWVPTWADDLTVAAVIADNATVIDVEAIGYTKYLLNESNRRDIRIELVNGTVFYRHITGAVEVSATVERLSIDTSLGVTVQPSQVALVSFMGMSRSDSDSHELAYFTGDVADTAFTAKGYRNDL